VRTSTRISGDCWRSSREEEGKRGEGRRRRGRREKEE